MFSLPFLKLIICVLSHLSILVSLTRGLSIFLIFSEPAFGFTDFLYGFPVFNFIDFCFNSYFFSSAYIGFNLLIFYFPKVEIIGFRSFFFPKIYIQCYEFPSSNCYCCNPQILTGCVFIFIYFKTFFNSLEISSVVHVIYVLLNSTYLTFSNCLSVFYF